MLTIRSGQLHQIADERFARRMADFLRTQFPDARSVKPETLHKVARQQIQRARKHGLTEEGHTASYVVSAWVLGEEFDEKMPAAAAVLNDQKMAAAAKAKWLDEWTVQLLEALEGKAP